MHMLYQPIVSLPQREIVGYEALARFDNEKTPDETFKAAWREGRGESLEAEAIEMAIRNFPHNISEAYLAVNASAKTIIAMRGELINDPGLEVPWPRLVIEISEKDTVSDYQLLDESLSLLRQRKVRLGIDDLGAGISGLAHILQIIPDILKIDRVLVQNIGENPIKRAMLRAVVGIGRDLRSVVVAEGIETEEEMKWCAGLGVDCGQGFLLGRPAPFPDALEI
jgi:EAL domain-containing protein (putative c-di-GMP-specific phosphodiesterase class I)